MEFFLQEPGEARLPPQEVRLRQLQITPLADGRRVKIFLELSPFQKRPNVEVTIFGASGQREAHSTILEATLSHMELTIHLRTAIPGCAYRVETCIFYQKLPEPDELGEEVPLPEPLVVDRQEVTFSLPLQAT